MPKVSIIVPVYKVEAYLDKCVQSLLAQTLEDVEILLVDDGSPDRCPAICDTYAARDSRVKVIHQQNAGVSAARNAGLTAATGEYVGFTDSDDWAEPDMYRCMYEAAQGADAVSSYPFTHFLDGHVVEMRCPYLTGNRVISRKEWNEKYITFFAGSAWNFLYRRELIVDHHLQFITDLKRSEDRIFNLAALSYARQMVFVDRPLYHYFLREGSATQCYVEDLWDTVLLTDVKTQEVLRTCWNGQFTDTYKRDVIIRGAVLTVRSVCSFKNPAQRRERIEQLRAICRAEELKAAFAQCGVNGSMEKWLARDRAGMLHLSGRCYALMKDKIYDGNLTEGGGISALIRVVARLRHKIIFRSK